MDPATVLLIGVFDPKGESEGFCYSVNAPINLWVGAVCSDGSRMGHEFMQYMLNGLILNDSFTAGDIFQCENQAGVQLTAVVGDVFPSGDLQAFQACTEVVTKVTVHVGDWPITQE